MCFAIIDAYQSWFVTIPFLLMVSLTLSRPSKDSQSRQRGLFLVKSTDWLSSQGSSCILPMLLNNNKYSVSPITMLNLNLRLLEVPPPSSHYSFTIVSNDKETVGRVLQPQCLLRCQTIVTAKALWVLRSCPPTSISMSRQILVTKLIKKFLWECSSRISWRITQQL